ncbi:ABC transporter ATP-binding protein, partial [Thioclava sp. BHET1]
QIVERSATDPLFYETRHPYTSGLIAAVPTLEGEGPLRQIDGTPPSIFSRPKGCAFAPRCPRASALCGIEDPPRKRMGCAVVACHHPVDIPQEAAQ